MATTTDAFNVPTWRPSQHLISELNALLQAAGISDTDFNCLADFALGHPLSTIK